MELEYKRCSIFYILLLFLCNVICLAAENDPEIFNIQVCFKELPNDRRGMQLTDKFNVIKKKTN